MYIKQQLIKVMVIKYFIDYKINLDQIRKLKPKF